MVLSGKIDTTSVALSWIVLIVSILFAALFIANAYYFYRVEQNPIPDVSRTTALVMMSLNIVAAIVTLIILAFSIYNLIKLYQSPSVTVDEANKYAELKRKEEIDKADIRVKEAEKNRKVELVQLDDFNDKSYAQGIECYTTGPGKRRTYKLQDIGLGSDKYQLIRQD